ncbi:DNA primase large subunit [Caerostris extrusa]|uniref:DNA primase large subunit n=1 Tax=Caerostris extrusa TaxID=172846 RepID=A0AAV4VLL9_CAEEX|nr:DNA primase large subunit [Caerostris extrusa]
MKEKSIEEISLGLQQEMYAICAECLIEGSLKDRISHFILRLLCSAYPDMQTFFIQMTLKKSIIKVPFTAALDFVEKRLYPINYGYIEVPFHSIKQLCAVIFKETLIQGLNQKIVSNCTQLKDPRVDYMLQDIKQWFKAKLKIPIMLISNIFILEKNLDNESENFPLCMLSLHHLLSRNHRLPHASRPILLNSVFCQKDEHDQFRENSSHGKLAEVALKLNLTASKFFPRMANWVIRAGFRCRASHSLGGGGPFQLMGGVAHKYWTFTLTNLLFFPYLPLGLQSAICYNNVRICSTDKFRSFILVEKPNNINKINEAISLATWGFHGQSSPTEA